MAEGEALAIRERPPAAAFSANGRCEDDSFRRKAGIFCHLVNEPEQDRRAKASPTNPPRPDASATKPGQAIAECGTDAPGQHLERPRHPGARLPKRPLSGRLLRSAASAPGRAQHPASGRAAEARVRLRVLRPGRRRRPARTAGAEAVRHSRPPPAPAGPARQTRQAAARRRDAARTYAARTNGVRTNAARTNAARTDGRLAAGAPRPAGRGRRNVFPNGASGSRPTGAGTPGPETPSSAAPPPRAALP